VRNPKSSGCARVDVHESGCDQHADGVFNRPEADSPCRPSRRPCRATPPS
jgi:hypothetical protein